MVSGAIQRTFWANTTGFLWQYNRAFGGFWGNSIGFLGQHNRLSGIIQQGFSGNTSRFLGNTTGFLGHYDKGFWGNTTGCLGQYIKVSGGFWGRRETWTDACVKRRTQAWADKQIKWVQMAAMRERSREVMTDIREGEQGKGRK
eukprot:4038813-Pleurochrysis_carterae.AAC.1